MKLLQKKTDTSYIDTSLKVIIPSAALVPVELQNIGKLPGIIYPVNQGIVFDYLYKQYKEKCSEIKIICHDASDKVFRRLSRYVGSQVTLQLLPQLSDLGHTIHFALKDETAPVVINFADTIVMDDITTCKGDAYYYSEDYQSDIWTFFREENGVITSVCDKMSLAKESELKEKLFVGVFLIREPQYFKECLETAFLTQDRRVSTFYDALCRYSNKYPMEAVKTENWFDVGHIDTYYNSRLEVRAREFNHITIDKDRGILRKSSDEKDKFIGEIKWYLKLPADIEYVRPRIFDYSTSYAEPYISMEYYAYHTVHELFLYGDLTYHQWRDVFNRIRFVCEDFNRYKVSGEKIRASLEEMYLTKTQKRLAVLREDNRFSAFFHQPVTVNHITYMSLDKISEVLADIIPGLLYDVESFSIIHGDLCFTNIMVDSQISFIKMIDPRGKFGTYDIYGDFRYELAKLFHSVDGKYDFIIKDLMNVEYDLKNAGINYEIADRKRDYSLYKILTEVFRKEIGEDLQKIELIEALLFLSMVPLHGESLAHQMTMLGTGIEILARVTDIRQ